MNIYKFILYKILGWKIIGDFKEKELKKVIHGKSSNIEINFLKNLKH